MRKVRGIVTISGGLDSILAARVLMDQGIDLEGFHCVLPFVAPDVHPSHLIPVQVAERLGLPIHLHRCDQEYIDIMRDPRFGYGKHANACIDCHIYFFRKAAERMCEIGAAFVATGEVVGQRPMSQMRGTMNRIEKESGLSGRLLRPLSAQLLAPTIPEEEGIVDRQKLLAINGRSRRAQVQLARCYGIVEYETPSGGCLFTDPNIARRVHDLFRHHEDADVTDLYLLTIGRHFRISSTVKMIVGRNEKENIELEKYMEKADLFCIPEFKGPVVYVKGESGASDRDMIARLLFRYGKPIDEKPSMRIYRGGVLSGTVPIGGIMPGLDIEALRI